MSEPRRPGLGVKAAQTLPAARIDESNIAEAVQKLTDLLGSARLGRASDSSVYVCGILLKNVDSELEKLAGRISALEEKNGGTDG